MIRLFFSLIKVAFFLALGVFMATYQIEGRTVLDRLKEYFLESKIETETTEVATTLEQQEEVIPQALPESRPNSDNKQEDFKELITPSDKTKLNKLFDAP